MARSEWKQAHHLGSARSAPTPHALAWRAWSAAPRQRGRLLLVQNQARACQGAPVAHPNGAASRRRGCPQSARHGGRQCRESHQARRAAPPTWKAHQRGASHPARARFQPRSRQWQNQHPRHVDIARHGRIAACALQLQCAVLPSARPGRGPCRKSSRHGPAQSGHARRKCRPDQRR